MWKTWWNKWWNVIKKSARSKQEQNDENWWETWWPSMRTNSETVTTWYKLRACDKNDIKTHDKLIKTEEVRMKYGKNDITKTSQHNDRQYMRKWWTYTVKQCKKQWQNAENWWRWWSMIRTIQKQWQHNETWWNKWNMMDTLQKTMTTWWKVMRKTNKFEENCNDNWTTMEINEQKWNLMNMLRFGSVRVSKVCYNPWFKVFTYILYYILLFIFWFDTFYLLRYR